MNATQELHSHKHILTTTVSEIPSDFAWVKYLVPEHIFRMSPEIQRTHFESLERMAYLNLSNDYGLLQFKNSFLHYSLEENLHTYLVEFYILGGSNET